jgi:UDP-perosamine 4-acetyltransferase
MKCLIIGAGGHGKVVLEILHAAKKHEPVGFIDADPSLAGQTIGGLKVLGAANALPKLKAQKIKHAIIAIGDNRARRTYAQLLDQHGFILINAVHPKAIVAKSATLGKGVVIAAGAMVGPEAFIGDLAIINTGALVEHECVIGEAVHIGPTAALAGRVRVGELAFVGLGAKVIQCLTVGAEAVVGAGTVVIRDVAAKTTVVGVPARIIKNPPV